MRLFQVVKKLKDSETGVALIEALVALAILGVIAVTFLSGLATTSKAAIIVDKQATAGNLAQSQMEWAKNADYVYEATEYSVASVPSGKDYINYSATITAEPLNNPDDGIQKIVVMVEYYGKEVIEITGYKADR